MFNDQPFSSAKSRWLSGASVAAIAIGLAGTPVLANPQGGVVVGGAAHITGEGSAQVTITQSSNRAIVNWDSFSIAQGESTVFNQPNAQAVAANRVVGMDPSEIMGTLQANGQVVLVNRNGVLLGETATVDAAGLVATTHDFEDAAFMAGGPLQFSDGGVPGASVVNEGRITIHDAGMAALVAPHVRNSGIITAELGRVALGSGAGFTLDLYGDGLISFAAGDELAETLTDANGTPLKALVENEGEISAAGGRILLTAAAAREVVNQSVNTSGIVRAETISQADGVITLAGTGQVSVETGAVVSASGAVEGGRVEVEADSFSTDGVVEASGGTITVKAETASLGGRVSTSGADGGIITVETAGLLSLAENVEAKGETGAGGAITYRAGRIMETTTGLTDVSGATDGGIISVEADQTIATSGTYRADGQAGQGGRIDMTAPDVRLLSAGITARGEGQGGLVRIGGAFQGGKTPDESKEYYDSFVARWPDAGPLANATQTFVNDGTVINVSSQNGDGGTAVIWSDLQTTFLGGVDASGATSGGAVEISSAADLRKAELANVGIGAGGHLLLDPKNIIIGTSSDVSSWSYEGIIGAGYISGDNIDVPALGSNNNFGTSVSLNAVGDRLAVGAFTNAPSNAGAVYLFSFADVNYAGGALESVIGSGSTGGKNVDVTLGANDFFGRSVSLNDAGDRLAVGGHGDDGSGNAVNGAGAAYLFSFTDTSFSGGVHEVTIGADYTGGKNVDLTALTATDAFGSSIALNGAGDRLAVGAFSDDGSGNGVTDSGAVYLFSFTDTSFSGGNLEATVGADYTGGKNVDVTGLSGSDGFGSGVSLNSAGDRLAVGAWNDDGGAGGAGNSGGVHLFSFTDGNFSGGVHEGSIGDNYSGGKNIDVALGGSDQFGVSVSLNSAGDRLAVGARTADGFGNSSSASGEVHLFSFTDGNFSGGVHEATVGAGYSGGKNIDVSELQNGDEFGGYGVALNGAGDRLAVGARADDAAANNVSGSGAVYLFTFTDTSFSGGVRAGIVGDGYVGGNNLDVTTLGGSDQFGRSVSLNAAGDRLAVGVTGDDGATNGVGNAGAVYLFSFTDDNYSGGALEATIGSGYTGGKNMDIAALDATDNFGVGVSLNAAGDRLAVGADRDDGPSDASVNPGAVYLFSFTDTNFSGGNHEATIGDGYTGGKNLDVTALGTSDIFGISVSLNAAGDRLAVGAELDDAPGQGNAGAVHLFSFTDTTFTGATHEATIGSGYTGGKNVDLTALEGNDFFGASVALNAAGDRLAVGARADDGAGNTATNAGAAYLFSFTDTSFTGGVHEATIGSGYTGGKNVDLTVLAADDEFGRGMSLNAAGDRLAIGAIGDDGSGDAVAGAGAVYLFDFTDTSFTGGTLEATIGAGYTGGKNVNLTALEANDQLGYGVSLNAAGDRLAAGAFTEDGASNNTSAAGAVYLFTANDLTSGGAGYGDNQSATVNIAAANIAGILDNGTAVTLQASNDITVSEAITVTGTPSSVGALTLQAGRSILVNADITTAAGGAGGAVTLIANDTLANGVIDAERDAGAAVITMANGTAINAGPGAVTFELRDGAGKTNTASGDITVGSITADTITITNDGPTSGSGVIIDTGAMLTGNALGGTAIEIAGDDFTNNGGASALATSGAGRFLVWSGNPTADNRGGLAYDFKQYNATFGSSTVSGDPDQSGFLYTLAPNVTPSLTGTVTKTYNANTAATLAAGNYSVSGAVDGDTVTITSTAAAYDNKNVGTGKTVTASGISVASASNGSADVYGYGVAATTANAAIGVVNQAMVTASLTGSVSKTYNANTAATLAAGNYNLTGVMGSDTAALNNPTSGTYDNKNVGTGKTVNVTGLALSGADAANYTLASTSINGAVGAVTAASLTITGVTASDKVYNANTTAALSGGSLSGVLGGDTVTLNAGSASGAFGDKNVGTGKAVTASGYALAGADAANYTLTQPTGLTADITAATLTITGVTAADKVYNANTTASLSGGSLSGVLSGDTVTLSSGSASGAFADKNVGTGKAVTASGYAISGADASNYSLTQPTGLTADITAAALTVTGMTADDKTYDATVDATFTGGTLSGIQGSDTVTLNSAAADLDFANKNVGTGKSVTASGFALAGADAANYTLTQPTGLTADITAATLTVAGMTADDKTYDATVDAAFTGGTLSGVQGSDTVTLNSAAADLDFANKNVGTGKSVTASGFALAGADASNYTLTQPTGLTADITAAALTVTGMMADDKTYDGTVDAAFTGGTLSGIQGSDTVTLNSAAADLDFDNKNVGTGKSVTASGFALAGADALNYTLTQPTGLTADITAKALTVTGITVDDKTYDTTIDATFTGGALSGVIGSEVVTLNSGAANLDFADKNVGTGKSVTALGFALGGADAANYTLTQPTGLTADITAATVMLSGSFTASDKVYDATTDVSIDTSGLTLAGVLGADDVAINTAGATGAFANKNVGTAKTVSLSGGSLMGADSGNYVVGAGAPTATASITPATLTVRVANASKVQNEPDPTFTYTISGFVSGEDESLVSGVRAVSAAPGLSAAPGQYAITASGGSAANYTFAYVDGVLTVTPAPTSSDPRDVATPFELGDDIALTPSDPIVDQLVNALVPDEVANPFSSFREAEADAVSETFENDPFENDSFEDDPLDDREPLDGELTEESADPLGPVVTQDDGNARERRTNVLISKNWSAFYVGGN